MKLRDFTVIARQAFYFYLTGKETAVEFAGLAGSCGCDKKSIKLVAHKGRLPKDYLGNRCTFHLLGHGLLPALNPPELIEDIRRSAKQILAGCDKPKRGPIL